MKKIIISVLLPVIAALTLEASANGGPAGNQFPAMTDAASTFVAAQGPVDIVFPVLETRLDSLSFYLGMVSGFDIADDLEAVDMRIVALGLLSTYLSGEGYGSDVEEYLAEYLSVIHSDEIAESRAELRSLGDNDPNFIKRGIGRHRTTGRAGGFLETNYPAGLPDRTFTTNSLDFAEVPELSSRIDWVQYYRGIKEGAYVASWLDEVSFKPLVQGLMAGFAIGDMDNIDFEDASNYLYNNLYGSDERSWRDGIRLPASMDVPELKNDVDSISFFFGIYLGSTMLDETPEIDIEMVMKGLREGYLAEDIPVSTIYDYLVYYFEVVAKDRKRAMAMAEVKEELDSLAALPGYRRTTSGLIYDIVEEGDMSIRVTDMYDKVDIEYTIYELDGTLHARTDDDDSPRLADMMEGFYEAVTLVGAGGSVRMYIPPGLTDDADGYLRSHGSKIFRAEVKLNDVHGRLSGARARAAVQGTLDELMAAPGRQMTESGLIYEIKEQGDMDFRVEGLSDKAQMIYRVTRLSDGDLHDSSGGDGSVPSLGDMMEGFFEGVQLIGLGGKITLWIPPGLTNDADGYSRNHGSAIFKADITLLDINSRLAAERVRPIMDSLAARPGVQRTESGLLYEIIEQGDMDYRITGIRDDNKLRYTVRYLDGDSHASSGEKGEECSLGDMMEGFFEGVTLVGIGGQIKLWIPPGLTNDADGYRRDHGSSIFKADITVLDVDGRLKAIEMQQVQGRMDSLAALRGYHRTESGLVYQIVEQGNMDFRVEGLSDKAEMIYRVTYLDGSSHDSSGEDGKTPSMGDMMEGFYEGVKLIGAGGKIKLFIPPTLTNDADGYKRNHGPEIFKADIELVDVNNRITAYRMREQVRPTLDSLAALPGIHRTESGLMYEIIEQGDMDYRVSSISDDVKLKYTVHYLNGDSHARSEAKGEMVSLGDMLEGFYEGVKMVGLGGRIKLYIPPGLTNDADGYTRSHGNSIFKADIEVLDVHGKMAEREIAQSRITMDSLAALPNYIRTDSGLLYEIIEQGDMDYRVTRMSDDVEAKYVIYYLDDEIFSWNGASGGSPSLGDMMEGFYEGIKLIGAGGRIKLVIPPGLTNDADGYSRNHGGTIFKADIRLIEAPYRR